MASYQELMNKYGVKEQTGRSVSKEKKGSFGNRSYKELMNQYGVKELDRSLSPFESEETEVRTLEANLNKAKSLYVGTMGAPVVGGPLNNSGLTEQLKLVNSLGYTSLDEMEKDLNQKRQVLNSKRLAQKASDMAETAARDRDFEKFASSGRLIYSDSRSRSTAFGGRIGGYNASPEYEVQLQDVLKRADDIEKKVYFYYLGKYGKEKAEEFLKSIQEGLNYREAMAQFEKLQGRHGAEVAQGVLSGLDQFEGGLRAIGSNEYEAPSVKQMLGGMAREELKENTAIGGFLYDLTSTTANMLPSILTSAAVGTVSRTAGAIAANVLLGASAGGNAYQQMLNLGYDKSQARSYGIITGASEACLQYALGGIGKLGGRLSKGALDKAIAGIDNAAARFSIKFGGEMLSEGLEEGLQEVLDPIFKRAIFNTDEEIDWEEVAYSALLGAASAGLLNGSSAAIGKAEYNALLRELYTPIAPQMIAVGLECEEGTESRRLAEKLNRKLSEGKKLGTRELTALAEANNEAVSKKQEQKARETEAAIEDGLKTPEGTRANTLAHKLQERQLEGEELSSEEISALSEAIEEYKSGPMELIDAFPETSEKGAALPLIDAPTKTSNTEESAPLPLIDIAENKNAPTENTAEAENVNINPSEEVFEFGLEGAPTAEELISLRLKPELDRGLVSEAEVMWAAGAVREGKISVDEAIEMIKSYALRKEFDNGRQGSDGSVGREPGVGTDKQNGSVSEGTGRDKGERRQAEREKPGDGKADVKLHKEQRTSLRELGVENGSEDKILKIDKSPNAATKRVMKAFAPASKSITPVKGKLKVINAKGKSVTVSGVKTSDGKVVFRTDHPLWRSEQLAIHEGGHLYIDEDIDLRQKLYEALCEKFSREEIDSLCAEYALKYEGLYDESSSIDEQEEWLKLYLPELLCDALAGMSRSGTKGTAKLQDTVRELFKAETGIDIEALLTAEEVTESEERAEEAIKPPEPKAKAPPAEGENNKEIRYPQYTEKDIENNSLKLSSMDSVCTIPKEKLERGDKQLKEIYSDYFDKFGGMIYSKEFGSIALTNSSVRSEIRHGSTSEKIAAIEAIEPVIQNGVVIFYHSKTENDSYRIVVAAPIIIGQTDYYMGVMLQRDSHSQRLYLHDVIIAEETTLANSDNLSTTGSENADNDLFLSSILQKALLVKPDAVEGDTGNGETIKKDGDKANQTSLTSVDATGAYSPSNSELKFSDETVVSTDKISEKTEVVKEHSLDEEEQNSYSAGENFSPEDIKAIQSIGKKSVNDFSPEEIAKTERFARKYWREMGTKSPFFRAWFGDWRAHDTTAINSVVIDVGRDFSAGKAINNDTGVLMSWGSDFIRETRKHQRSGGIAYQIAGNIENIVKDAVLLDTYASSLSSKTKMPGTAMMHSFYCAVNMDGQLYIMKLYAEEAIPIKNGAPVAGRSSFTRAYELKDIEKVATLTNGVLSKNGGLTDVNVTTIDTVSDLFEHVKRYDKDFSPKAVNTVLLNDDGTPKVVYHGTDAEFSVFDISRGRANMDIQGAFFSPYELDAQGYGENVGAYYLSVKNPADEGTAYKALNRFKGQNEAGIKARNYLISQGYDGVYNGYDEYIAFYPEQIKSATDNIGTFDKANPDVRYSLDEEEQNSYSAEEDKKITAGMTDSERYEILKDKAISLSAKPDYTKVNELQKKLETQFEDAQKLKLSDRDRLFIKLGEQFGVFKTYYQDDVRLSFEFTKRGMRESEKKQRDNYLSFAKMLSCFDAVIDNAIGIEVHNRNSEGYKVDDSLKNVYVLVSAFEDKGDTVPVKLEIKEFFNKENKLYVAVALESIKKDEVVEQVHTDNGDTDSSRSSKISLSDLLSKIKPEDVDFVKYVPKQFMYLSEKNSYSAEETGTEALEERVKKMSLNKLKENRSRVEGMIRGYESSEKLTEKGQRELETLKRNLGVYDKAVEEKKEKQKAQKERREKALEEAESTVTPSNATTRSRRDFAETIIKSFNILSGKGSLRASLNAFLDKYIEQGRISRKDIRAIWDLIVNQSDFVIEPDNGLAEIRSFMQSGKIYVNESTIAEFGDDWQAFKRRCFGNRIYLTDNPNARGVDSWSVELAAVFGEGLFPQDADLRTQLENICELVEDGKAEHMNLYEMAKRYGKNNEEELLEHYYRELEIAIKAFAASAKIEMELTKENAYQLAKERLKRQEQYRAAQERKAEQKLMNDTLKQLKILERMRRKSSNEVKAQIDKVLEGIDTLAIHAANELNYSKKYDATWKDIAAMYAEAKENDPNFLPDRYIETVIIPRTLGKHIGDMSVEDVQELYRAAIALRTEIYNAKNVIGSETAMMFSEAYDAVSGEIKSAEKPKGLKSSNGKKAVKALNKWRIYRETLNPIHYLEALSGWNPDSVFFKTFAKGLEEGEKKLRRFTEQATGTLDSFLEENKDWLRVADGQGKDGIWYEYEVKTVAAWPKGQDIVYGETVKVSMTPLQKIHMYLESKSYDNLEHMLGGRVFADRGLYSEGKKAEAFKGEPVNLPPEEVRRISGDLTEQEMELANILEKYYNGMAKEEINKVSNALYGFDRAMGSYYAPIYTKETYVNMQTGKFDGTAEGVGNLKERKNGAKTPTINISAFEGFERNVSQTARFVGMAIPIHNFEKLLNWSSNGEKLQGVIEKEWTSADKDYIKNLLSELQSPSVMDNTGVDTFLDKMQSAYIGATFAFNPSVAAKVFGSWFLAASELGWGNAKAGFNKVDEKLVSKYTSELDVRKRGYTTFEVAKLVNSQTKLNSFIQDHKVTRELFGGGLMIHADVAVTRSMWAWAEAAVRNEQEKVDEKLRLEIGTQEMIDAGQSPFYREVAKRYETAIGNTQSMYDVMHRSRLMRSKSKATQTFTMFHTDIMQAANLFVKARNEAAYYAKASKGEPENKKLAERAEAAKKKIGTTGTAVIASSMLVALITALNALWKRKDDYFDDEGNFEWDKLGVDYGSNVLKDLAGMMPFADVLTTAIIDYVTAQINGEDFYYYDINLIGVDYINKLVKAGTDFADAIQGEKDVLKAAKGAAFTLSRLTGFPLDNVERYVLGMFDWVSPELAEAYDNLWRKPKKASLKGKYGTALERDVYDMFKDFGLERESTDEMARLYGLGYTNAVMSDIPTEFSVHGEDYLMTEEDTELYKSVLDEKLEYINELLESEVYKNADDEEKAKQLQKLYDYARDEAKAAVLGDEYELSGWKAAAGELLQSGEGWDTIAQMPTKTVVMDTGYERYNRFVSSGIPADKATEIEEAFRSIQTEEGKSPSKLQKICTLGHLTISEDYKEIVMADLDKDSEGNRKRYRIFRDYGRSTADYADFVEVLDSISEGNVSRENFKRAVALFRLPGDIARDLWNTYGWKSSSPWG